MATVNAPYPSRMEEIDNGSIISMTRDGGDISLVNRGGDAVSDFQVQDEIATNKGAIVTLDAFDAEARDALVRDWYRPTFSNTKLANPATIPLDDCRNAHWSPDGRFIAIGDVGSAYPLIYERSGDTFTKLTDAAASVNGIKTLRWSPDGQYLAVGGTLPGLSDETLYVYKRSGTTLTQLSLGAITMPDAGYVTTLVWSPDGQYLLANVDSAPYMIMYKRTGDSFAEVTGAPDVNPGGQIVSASLDPSGQYLAVSRPTAVSPNLVFYRHDGDSLTKIEMLAAGFPEAGPSPEAMAWSPSGKYLVVGMGNAPRLAVYRRDGEVLTRLTIPTGVPALGHSGISWSPDEKYFAASISTTPYFAVYKRNGDAFSKIADPTSLPSSNSFTTAWSPDGKHLVVGLTATPFIAIYKSTMGPIGGPVSKIELEP